MISILVEVRKAFGKFLKSYPYCFVYWIKWSEIEKRHGEYDEALEVLKRGLVAMEYLSIDIWIAYLELYHKLFNDHDEFDTAFRGWCETAVENVGLNFHSDILWERYIEWEHERRNLIFITEIFRRLITIPTKLYNKHWDNFIAHVRDHHPRDVLGTNGLYFCFITTLY